MADEISLESVLQPQAPESVGKPAAGEVSLESIVGEQKPNYFEGFARRTAATVAGVGDFLWGIFPTAVGVGAELGARGYASGAGEDRRMAAQAGRAAAEAVPEMFGPLNNPFQKLMKATGYGEDYSSSDVTKALTTFSRWLEEKGLDIEKHTKGIVQKEDVALLTNILTLGLLNLRKGGLFKDDPASLKAAQRGPTGMENRPSYYEPDQVVARSAEAVQEVTTPPAPQAQALSRQSQLAGDMFDPIKTEDIGPGAEPQAPPAKPGEIPLDAFQFGTADKQVPPPEFKATGAWQEVPPGTALEPGLEIRMDMATGKNYARANPYKDLPGGTEPSAGGYTGPGAQYEPTATKPTFGERFVELWRNDRRWTPTDKLTVAIGAAATGSMLLDPDKWKELGLVGGAALAVKGKGGMWHPEAVQRLSNAMTGGRAVAELRNLVPADRQALIRQLDPEGHIQAEPGYQERVAANVARDNAFIANADRMVRNYLNKYAGTEGDPLRDVEIPMGQGAEPWHKAWDRTVNEQTFGDLPVAAMPPETLKAFQEGRIRKNEPMWNVQGDLGPLEKEFNAFLKEHKIPQMSADEIGSYLRGEAHRGRIPEVDMGYVEDFIHRWDQTAGGGLPIAGYLSHVGDYLRQKVSPEKLQQYDLVRAVKETRKWDDELAAKMNSVEGRLEGTEPYKKYPDKFQWVEVKSAEALKHEGDMMGHCVGGYCDYVASGNTKIYSLRDPKGAAHVTVEVEPASANVKRGAYPEGAPKVDNINQIKGKQNRAPTAEYLPYVQDFVKSGKWGDVRDLQNTGLLKVQAGPYKGQYLTPDEIRKIDPKAPQGYPAERGSADPRLLARLAALGLGAAAGAYLGEDAKSALLGAGVGLGAAMVKPSAAIALFKKVTAPDTRMRINHLADDYDTAVGRASLAAWQLQQKVEQLVPSVEGRKKITYALDEGDFSLLSPNERTAAGMLKNALQETGAKARDAGVLRDMLDNYITHLWGKDALAKIEELVTRVGGPNMSPESRFALKRKFSTLAEGKRAGLTPLTEDASAITGIYLNSISRSMANKQLLEALKTQVEPTTGNKIVQGAREAPGNYASIDHPQMRGLRVHPDIAPSLRFVFDATEPGTILRGLEAVSIATKRSAVSFSMFHAKALLDAFVGAAKLRPGYIAAGAAAGALVGQDDPITYALIGSGVGMMAPGLKHIAQAAAPKVFGENAYLKGLRTADPKMAEIIDLSIQGGLKYQLKGQRAALEDVYGTHDQFYKALKGLQTFVDEAIPGTGAVVKGIEKVNRGVDTFMWERLHAGMKLQTFAEKYETLLQNNAKAHESNPAVPLKSKAELAGIAASFTNDIFGGLNWRRAAEQATTKWGRDISLAAMSPTGRRVAQVMLFAPDWTLSTTRAAVQAFGKDTGLEGLLKPQTLADLHRQYILRSALYYGAMGEGLNYAMSGHHLWENQDPTTLDVGDGRKMQWSKHTMEPVHWITKPGQQALNKLAYIPREALNQLMGTEYLSTSGHAPRMQSRLGHAVKALSPISVQQSFEAGEGSGIAGFMGSPIYGKTYQQRATEKEIKRLERSLGVTR